MKKIFITLALLVGCNIFASDNSKSTLSSIIESEIRSAIPKTESLLMSAAEKYVKLIQQPVTTVTDSSIRSAGQELSQLALIMFILNGMDDRANSKKKLFDSINQNKMDELEKILKSKEVDICDTNEKGKTPLVLAVDNNNKRAVELLIEAGADVNKDIDLFGTPLLMAANDIEIARLLLAKGAGINKKQAVDKWYTSLMSAVWYGNTEKAKLLIESGADLEVRSSRDMTALMEAVDRYRFDMVKLLINYGADINAQDFPGNSSLMIAAIIGSEELVEDFLKAGADLNVKNKEGKTVFDLSKSDKVNSLLEDSKTLLDEFNKDKEKYRKEYNKEFLSEYVGLFDISSLIMGYVGKQFDNYAFEHYYMKKNKSLKKNEESGEKV